MKRAVRQGCVTPLTPALLTSGVPGVMRRAVALLLAPGLLSSSLEAAPITCQPLRAFSGASDFPTYHIMGHVSGSVGKGIGREAINDCSGIVNHRGVYHVFHQCCQNHWCVGVARPASPSRRML